MHEVSKMLVKVVLLVISGWRQWCCVAMDFERAVREDQFIDLLPFQGDHHVFLKYSGAEASKAFSFDARREGNIWRHHRSSEGELKNVSVTVKILRSDCEQQESEQSSFSFGSSNLELSLAIVQLARFDATSVLTVTVGQGDTETEFLVETDMSDPNTAYFLKERQTLFRTWPFEDDTMSPLPPGRPCSKFIRVSLTSWNPRSSVYFVSTLHKRMRTAFPRADGHNGCPNQGDEGGDFGCLRSSEAAFQVCIPFLGLVCNSLPNCAQTSLPNADEVYCQRSTMDMVLRVLVYLLSVLAVILIIAACARSCYISCYRRRENEAHCDREGQGAAAGGGGARPRPRSARGGGGGGGGGGSGGGGVVVSGGLLSYLSSSLPRRPRNAPPSYEDATKNDNAGFVDDDETPPPTYYDGVAAATTIAAPPPAPSGPPVVRQERQLPSRPPPYSEAMTSEDSSNAARQSAQ